MNNNKQILEEKLTLLETNSYPKLIEETMLIECWNIITHYRERDFNKQMNRYLILERKYKEGEYWDGE